MFIELENLVLGAGKGLPGQATTVPSPPWPAYAGSTAAPRCGARSPTGPTRGSARYQDDLALNGVDLTQVGRFGAQAKNAADIQMALDTEMETLIVHPDVTVFVLVTGDSDYRRAGPPAAGVRQVGGRRRHRGDRPRRLSSVCSEYKFWGTLVAEVDPAARPAVDAAFDIAAAEQLLVRAFKETARTTLTASAIKSKMVALDSSLRRAQLRLPQLPRLPRPLPRAGPAGRALRLGHHPGTHQEHDAAQVP